MMGQTNWSELTANLRNNQEEQDDLAVGADHADGATTSSSTFQLAQYFPALREQLDLYHGVLEGSVDDTLALNNRDKKAVIVETRQALRFGVCCVSSVGGGGDSAENDTRSVKRITCAQNEAVCQCGWHAVLVGIIAHRRGDSKCRYLSARLLSNLVTSNATTATILASFLPISPSEDIIASRIRRDTMKEEEGPVSDCCSASPQTRQRLTPPLATATNWVDLILMCARSSSGDDGGDNNEEKKQRHALEATIAALHNCIVSLEQGSGESSSSFPRDVASNSLLISTLLRHVIPVECVRDSIVEGAMSNTDNKPSHAEWTVYLIGRLTRCGLLGTMYWAAGGRGSGKHTALSQAAVLPEQLILLHCVLHDLEELSTKIKPFEDCDDTGSWINTSCSFLVTLFSTLHGANRECDDTTGRDTECEPLRQSAILLILDILGILLSADTVTVAKTRLCLGRETDLVHEVSQILGHYVDTLSKRNVGLKARDMTMEKDEQRMVNALVRLIGNLCFGCRQNQDLLRTTLVPLPLSRSLPHQQHQQQQEQTRSAMHVLLSVTSLSPCCLTLREWAIVAIRHALDDNHLNQAVVAELEAQQPVQSACLQEMGIRVNLDPRKGGKVSITPLDSNIVKEGDGDT